MENTLRDFLNTEVELAKVMFDKRGEIHIMFVGQDASGRRHPVLAITYGDDDKDAAAQMARVYFAAHGIVRYACHSEAWLLTVPKDQPIPATRPKDHPDRFEAVVVNAYDKGPNSLVAMMRITRKVNARARLAPVEITEGPSIGRFANLLETKQ